MNISAIRYFNTDNEGADHLAPTLNNVATAVRQVTLELPPRAPSSVPAAARTQVKRQLRERFTTALDATGAWHHDAELGMPFHKDFVAARPLALKLGSITTDTATLLAIDTLTDHMFTVSNAWTLARRPKGLRSGILIAPTTLFSRALQGYPNPVAHYAAMLKMTAWSHALGVPVALVGITPYEDDPEIEESITSQPLETYIRTQRPSNLPYPTRD